MIASIGVLRSLKAVESSCKEVKCHGSWRSGKSQEIMMGKYLFADRIGCTGTSWGFDHDVTKLGTLQKLSENKLKNFAWKCRSCQCSYFLEKERGGERKQRLKQRCWNTTGKLHGEEPFSFSWLQLTVLQQTARRRSGRFWKLFSWPQNLSQTQPSTTVWSVSYQSLGVLFKVKSKTSLTTGSRRTVLVSQLMLLESARPTVGTAAALGLITKRWECEEKERCLLCCGPCPMPGYSLQSGILPVNNSPAKVAETPPATLLPSSWVFRVCPFQQQLNESWK